MVFIALALQATLFQNARLVESSGVAVSRSHPGILWTLNDAGDGPRLYATDLRGSDRGFLTVPGVANIDWEDVALGPCPGVPGSCLYIADTGDNRERRDNVRIIAFPEPPPTTRRADTLRSTARPFILPFRYPDGTHDVEAMYVAPADSAVYLITKGRHGPIQLFRLPRRSWESAGPVTAEPVQRLPIQPNRGIGELVTGAAARPDGKYVVVRTYTEVFLFQTSADGHLTPVGPPCSVFGLEPQGEGIDFLNDSTFVLTSEAGNTRHGTIHSLRCPFFPQR